MCHRDLQFHGRFQNAPVFPDWLIAGEHRAGSDLCGGFPLGRGGVAWATFIAQGIACVLALLALRKKAGFHPDRGKGGGVSWNMLGRISRIAVPSILQQSFISVGNIFIQGLINSYGSSVIAGYSAAIKLNTFCITSITTLGNGTSSFSAQNLARAGRTGCGRGCAPPSGWR